VIEHRNGTRRSGLVADCWAHGSNTENENDRVILTNCLSSFIVNMNHEIW
jgi:hypothetical protein